MCALTDPDADKALAPPYSPELLADLHAGLLPPDVAARLRPLARADRAAAATLAALDATSADLRGLRDSGAEPMPELVAARLRRTLTTADPAAAATTVPARDSSRRSSKFAFAGAAGIVLGVGLFVGVSQFGSSATDPTPPPSALAAPTLLPDGTIDMPAGDVPPAVVHAVRNTAVVGRLQDQKLRSDCLSANGYAAGSTVLGSAPAKVGERLGTLLVIPGSQAPLVIALVLGDRCSATNPDLLAVSTVTD